MASTLKIFVDRCSACAAQHAEPADAVSAIAPHMQSLLKEAKTFLKPEHLRADPEHYARNAIFIAPDQSMSLYALVWTPRSMDANPRSRQLGRGGRIKRHFA